MNAVLVSVNYADYLAWTLPYNRHHFDRVVVVTSTDDAASAKIARDCNCGVLRTDIFFENGARFAKYDGLECGLDLLGRDGWIAILDADILIPRSATFNRLKIGNLYSAHRRMCQQYPPPREAAWRQFPRDMKHESLYLGYLQLFHADDIRLGSAPWHVPGFTTAADGDMEFMQKWPKCNRIRLPFEVLHLGEEKKNWGGRVTAEYQARDEAKSMGV